MREFEKVETAAQSKTYTTPTVTKIGNFESMTQHSNGTNYIDATFVAGTPLNQLLTS